MKNKTLPNPVVNDKREPVVIEGWDPQDTGKHTEWGIYDESGNCIEPDFKSSDAAFNWAVENNYRVVKHFNIPN